MCEIGWTGLDCSVRSDISAWAHNARVTIRSSLFPNKIFGWGANPSGYHLGNGVAGDIPVPAVIADDSGALAGATLVQHISRSAATFALSNNGSVFSWGQNSYGNLGHGDTISLALPKMLNSPLLTDSMIIQLAASDITTYALGSNGELFAWGYNGGNT